MPDPTDPARDAGTATGPGTGPASGPASGPTAGPASGPATGAADGPAASVTATVTAADTASALGSGDVDVLGTPRVLALLEAATVAAAGTTVGPGQTTVGTRVELDHLAPSPVGATVRAEARLVDRTGRRLTFEVRLTQDGREVATGRVSRAIVDRARFAQASTDERG